MIGRYRWWASLLVLAAGGSPAQIAPDGDEFQVNTYTLSNQERPGIARRLLPEEGRAMSSRRRWWLSLLVLAASGAAAQLSPNGGEFQVNTYTTSSQYRPATAVDPAGNLVVAWHSFGSMGTDTDDYSIQAQRFDALFRDGFETADTARWSAAAP